ncbi:branched-chain amino acid transport system II carrier protein [Shewanella litorisediminis]|uniref:Branched-chain amino acid transport system carrier protein n=1 Tax=Shewanella litorisediminis TaxID=1173586 RepID=A0ABX7G143_9GAMM|nr:branched-chain amino acid transport system II carrier protein [Shewanella litorisediminis]MCL2918933.1 branched-chain amino acid transport system II carrier protein [Shewanella litorisediminis]QRH01003.1 branched-chain amino acid transport system II carrier protein [Shewanella litorisediminis]
MGLLVQNKQMSFSDTLSLGFMTFAFFLGAGNLIFPPFAGMLAGDNMPLAMMGFLVTAVGMPLVGLIAVAKTQGKVMAYLPAVAATALAVAIYIIIGPAFAAPRTGLVAFEIGAKPFLGDTSTVWAIGSISLNVAQLIFTLGFFAVTMLLALFPGKLMDSVGKVLTPVLMVLLLSLAISVIMLPSGDTSAPVGDYASSPLIKGVIEGYNTMDTLASLMFGMLIIDLLRKKGVDAPADQTRALVRAAFIAASGLAFVYISLFFLGATAGEIAQGAENGGQILTRYVDREFGTLGALMLSTVVSLACLTTAVGLVSACSDYFNELFPRIKYRQFVILFSIICAVVANVGLTQLISVSIPVLVSVYPVVIALVAVTFMTQYLPNPRISHRLVLAVALLFGAIDGLKAAGVNMESLSFMPLYAEGMAWLLPTAVTMVICLFIGKRTPAAA